MQVIIGVQKALETYNLSEVEGIIAAIALG